MKKLVALVSFSLLAACGKKDDEAETAGRTVVVEVGAAAASLTGDTAPESEDENTVKTQEIQQCRDVFSGTVEGWKVSGSENEVSITPSEAFAIKITGNQNVLNLVIKAKEGETAPVSFPGVCLVLAGNKPTVKATLTDVTLEQFKVVGNGNDGRVDVLLEGAAALPEGTTEDLGKHVTVSVQDATP
jgi:hypothetical protein